MEYLGKQKTEDTKPLTLGDLKRGETFVYKEDCDKSYLKMKTDEEEFKVIQLGPELAGELQNPDECEEVIRIPLALVDFVEITSRIEDPVDAKEES